MAIGALFKLFLSAPYVNDKTDSTHFFSVHDGGVDFIGAKLADGRMYPYFGGAA